MVPWYSKRTRPLTFENFWQAPENFDPSFATDTPQCGSQNFWHPFAGDPPECKSTSGAHSGGGAGGGQFSSVLNPNVCVERETHGASVLKEEREEGGAGGERVDGWTGDIVLHLHPDSLAPMWMSKASPSHIIIAGHACTLAAVQCARKGTFTDFGDQATSNAAAVTPVGAWLLAGLLLHGSQRGPELRIAAEDAGRLSAVTVAA